LQVEIILEHGQVRLSKPVYLKPDKPHHFTIDIDDAYIAPSRDWFPQEFRINRRKPGVPSARPGSMQASINRIMGPFAIERPLSSIGDDHQMLMEALEERYLGC
jgi:hypothetical protein